ncbi:SDR family NAD(P)-dependent oxidoreductase [Amycolatopsis suaedae]|uniref:SDR family oxidoreductase n=1 Tax=Amycolatopsis suaedae TaxID=2510978 RepID=A0A4Q7JA28_9PSEU|nr:SDR family oxidoreductase [Amycolatopsis suaedae]RZQ64650.1 SDR family oxidoreductase [Amycolatopsis suaedae]
MNSPTRAAIVTGANHGIGAATAVALAEAGMRVLVTYLRLDDEPDPGTPEAYRRNRAGGADAVVERIRAAGGTAIAVEADLSDVDTPARLFDTAERELGGVDVLVNNASFWLADTFKPDATDRFGRSLDRISAGTFERQFAVDARGGALMIAEFAARFVARGGDWGRIVSLTSGAGNGFPEEVSYGAAKAALVDYTLSAGAELAAHGITANAVHPPVTDTGWVNDEVREHVRANPALYRVATPEQVAAVIAYLASPAADLVTGNVIHLR